VRRSPNRYYKIGLRNLAKQRKVLIGLDKYCKEFNKWQMGGVIRLETFHAIAAVQILLNALPLFMRANDKEVRGLKRKLK
jgi:hypothetical protein